MPDAPAQGLGITGQWQERPIGQTLLLPCSSHTLGGHQTGSVKIAGASDQANQ